MTKLFIYRKMAEREKKLNVLLLAIIVLLILIAVLNLFVIRTINQLTGVNMVLFAFLLIIAFNVYRAYYLKFSSTK